VRFQRWQAHGNVYLVSENDLSADAVRAAVDDADGIVQVTARGDDWADVVIWNPDGSTAEMSGNATRIVAAWLGAERTRVRVAGREVCARRLADGRIEQDLGDVRVFPAERVAGLVVTAVDVGNPHAVVLGDPDDLPLIGPLLETHPRFPRRTNVQVARIERQGHVSARVWERGVGETSASGTSAVAVAAATHGTGEVVVSFPGGDLTVRIDAGRAWLTGPAERLADDDDDDVSDS
jgi:diaminopimelate epimerase